MAPKAISLDELIDQQLRIGNALEKLINNYPTAAVRQDRLPNIYKTLAEVDNHWVAFIARHEQITSRTDIDDGMEYFEKDYMNTVKRLVSVLTEMISATITTVTGLDPKYDLINREYPIKRMFNDRGMRIPDQEEQEVAKETENENHDEANPKNDEVLPHIRDFFNQSGGTFKSTNGNSEPNGDGQYKFPESSAVNNLKIAIRATKKTVQEFLDIPMDDEPKKLRHIAKHIIEKWSQATRMHERLSSTELNTYDSRIFYDFEDQLRPILDQIYQMQDHQIGIESADGPKKSREKSIKMPQLELQKFNGDYAQWTVFKDLFGQMIEQRELTKPEKFMYLRSNLSGEASDLIQSLRITAENYDLAWEMLEERYENPRQIIKTMLNCFLWNEPRTAIMHR